MTPSGITRDMVLAAANGLRAAEPSSSAEAVTDQAVRNIIDRTVSVAYTSGDTAQYTAYPSAAGGHADGVLIDVTLHGYRTGDARVCTILALATTDPGWTLSGTATLATTSTQGGAATGSTRLGSAGLSGDVFVSPPMDTAEAGALVAAAKGDATRTVQVAPPTTIVESASTEELSAARRTYDQRLKDAKKKYTKAKKKAGRNKKKKAKAKRDYDRRKAAAKAAYAKVVKAAPTTKVVENNRVDLLPFELTISTDTGWALAG